MWARQRREGFCLVRIVSEKRVYMGRNNLSEEDIKAQYITPAVERAGWDIKKQVRFEYPFTAGRIILRGSVISRGKQKRVDPSCHH